jgi:hypothetical protein
VLDGARRECPPGGDAPLDDDRDPDRCLEEDQQGHHLERSRDGIDAGQRDCEGSHRDVADPAVLPELLGTDDADAHECDDHDGQLEHETDRDQHGERERDVVLRPDVDVVDVLVVRRQEADGGRHCDPVGEDEADREQAGRDRDAGHDGPLDAWVERRSEVAPRLPEQDGERDRDRTDERDLQRRHERLGHAEGHELLAGRKRRLEHREQARVERV